MLILKQNAANTVPTPPAGKGTIFLDDSDTLSVKTSDGNVETFPTVGASNAQVVFMNGTTLSGEAALTYDFNNNVLTVAGNVAAGNVKTDNLLYANGTAWDLSDPGGSNTQVQFNDDESFGGSAAFTFNKTSNVVTMSGNANIGNIGTAQLLASANVTAPQLISNVSTGTAPLVVTSTTQVANLNVANAGHASTANTIVDSSQPNITSVGTLTGLVVSGHITPSANVSYDLGNATNAFRDLYLDGNSIKLGGATIRANATSIILQNPIGGQVVVSGNSVASTSEIINGTSNVNIPSANSNVNISVNGTANVLVVTGTGANITGTLNATGNANVGNIGATNGVFTNVSGNGSALSSITGANVTGQVGYAAVANSVAGANVSGEVGFAAVANSVAGANVSGQVGNALVAGTVYTNAQPNITSVGTLSSLAVTGNATAGNVYANSGTIGAANLTGTLTTAAQPNITSVGTLSSLAVTGNVAAGNLTTVGVLSVTGTGVSSIAGNLDMTSNTIINLATPTNATDAATKQYVDDVAQGLNVHDSAAAATTGTLAAATGGTITYNNGSSGVGATLTTTGSYTTIDGVNVATVGTRILVKNEANAAHNGIYTYTSSTVITRATDYDSVPEVEAGDFIFVTGGTVYDNTGWVQTSTVATIGTDAIDFTQFSGAGTYNAGTGLTLTGTTFSVNASQTQITSVGTLSGLNVNGTVTASAFTANTGVFTGNGSGLSQLTGANVTGQVSFAATANAVAGANVSGQVSNALVAGTVYTAAQPNITSVGTLSSLAVTGNVTAANFSGNHYGNGSTLEALNASNITSGTLAQARLANASATINGTTVTLGGTSTITANTTQTLTLGSYLTGTSFNGGTAVTAAVDATTTNTASKVVARDGSGNFSAGTITATLSGAATTAGTVTTAAQPNITSVGTLTGLTVSGATSVTGNSALTVTNLTTGANSTAGYITGNWSLTTGSKLQATYADLAEKYAADASYESGTVLLFGGDQEVTISNALDSHAVAGVVSTNPAYVMNSGCQGDHVVELALQGRVPVKVHGPVAKGDLMVSGPNGHAVANNMARAGTIIGKALENFEGAAGVIEVVVGRV